MLAYGTLSFLAQKPTEQEKFNAVACLQPEYGNRCWWRHDDLASWLHVEYMQLHAYVITSLVGDSRIGDINGNFVKYLSKWNGCVIYNMPVLSSNTLTTIAFFMTSLYGIPRRHGYKAHWTPAMSFNGVHLYPMYAFEGWRCQHRGKEHFDSFHRFYFIHFIHLSRACLQKIQR